MYFDAMTIRLHHTLAMLFILAASSVLAQEDIPAMISEAKQLRLDGKKTEATDLLKKILISSPDHPEARYEMGWLLNDTKDYTGAMTNLRIARKKWSLTPKVYFELGYAFEKLNMNDSAIAQYKKTLELKSDYSLAHKQLGTIAYNTDDNLMAIKHFQNYERAAKSPITDYLYWYRKGFCFNATKNYDSALAALNKSAEYKPDNFNTWLEIGFANSRLKKVDESISAYEKAIKINPQSHIGYNGIAEVYRDVKKDMNEAMVWYKKSLNVDATERKACFGMGYCLNSLGKYAEAISYLKTAIEKESTYTAAYTELGYSYYMTSKNEEAITNLKKAISLSPLNENSRYYLGLVYIIQKNRPAALTMVEELKKLSSRHAATLQTKIDAME